MKNLSKLGLFGAILLLLTDLGGILMDMTFMMELDPEYLASARYICNLMACILFPAAILSFCIAYYKRENGQKLPLFSDAKKVRSLLAGLCAFALLVLFIFPIIKINYSWAPSSFGYVQSLFNDGGSALVGILILLIPIVGIIMSVKCQKGARWIVPVIIILPIIYLYISLVRDGDEYVKVGAASIIGIFIAAIYCIVNGLSTSTEQPVSSASPQEPAELPSEESSTTAETVAEEVVTENEIAVVTPDEKEQPKSFFDDPKKVKNLLVGFCSIIFVALLIFPIINLTMGWGHSDPVRVLDYFSDDYRSDDKFVGILILLIPIVAGIITIAGKKSIRWIAAAILMLSAIYMLISTMSSEYVSMGSGAIISMLMSVGYCLVNGASKE